MPNEFKKLIHQFKNKKFTAMDFQSYFNDRNDKNSKEDINIQTNEQIDLDGNNVTINVHSKIDIIQSSDIKDTDTYQKSNNKKGKDKNKNPKQDNEPKQSRTEEI